MKALHSFVVYHYWNKAGGGQLVCAAIAKVLDFTGFRPILVSTVKIDVSKYPEWFGIDLSNYPTIDLGVELKAFGIYLRLLVGLAIKKALRKYDVEPIFTDECTYKQVLSDLRKRGAKLIEYIHFPIEASFKRGFRQMGVYYGDDPYVLERYGKFPMNIYYKLYLKLLPPFLRDNPFTIASLVLTNSKWNAKLAKMVYGEEPVILNPPLPPNLDVAEKVKPFDLRDCAVVMVGRFSEEKRYHWVLQEVFPRLKKACSDAKLYIFGATGTRTAKAYYARLFELTKSVGFKASAALGVDADVYLVENAPRSLINDVMVGARVFLHATINEPWGMEPLTERAVQSSPAT